MFSPPLLWPELVSITEPKFALGRPCEESIWPKLAEKGKADGISSV